MTSALPQGLTIERYRIEQLIGAGSMGDVFLGLDVDLDRKVAVKILAEKHRDNDELRARFSREARAVAAISHPNVVQVFTTGSYDDRPYIAMEFLDGIDLGTLVESEGPRSPLVTARAARDAALGLEAAARAGLIHRDVKPSNLVLLREGLVKVTDFGLAKPLDPGDEPALTALGVVVGTPDYIAPEQARGESLDERVDIYALGGTLFYLLIGQPPYRTGIPAEDKYLKVVARHLKQPVPDARARDPRVDPELAALARAMMAKKSRDRPGYGEVIDRLSGVVAGLEGAGARHTGRAARRPRRTGGRSSPTPFVGGAHPNAATGAPGGLGARAAAELPPAEFDDAAPTHVHVPAHSGGRPVARADSAPVVVAPRVSRVLVALTAVSILLFLSGLGLLLFGPMPHARPGALLETAADAQATAGAVTHHSAAEGSATADAGALAAAPGAPDGMFLVRRPNGAPWFFADRRPVTHDEYAAVFPRQKKPDPRRGERPVTEVSYPYAQAFARARGRRLPSEDEWRAAAAAPEFVAPDETWEWIESDPAGDPGDEAAATRPVRSRVGADTRAARGADDVSFRLAADLAAVP